MRRRPRAGSREGRALLPFQAASLRAARTRRARAPPPTARASREGSGVFPGFPLDLGAGLAPTCVSPPGMELEETVEEG